MGIKHRDKWSHTMKRVFGSVVLWAEVSRETINIHRVGGMILSKMAEKKVMSSGMRESHLWQFLRRGALWAVYREFVRSLSRLVTSLFLRLGWQIDACMLPSASQFSSAEVSVFFIVLREELALLISLRVCAVQLVLSLESSKIHCLTSGRL